MIKDTIEETLEGGYAGLVGEVQTEDIYRLKQLDFTPSVIFDLGGNVSVFAKHARSIFPDALIISVEPDKENFEHFTKFTSDPRINLYWRCIGKGNVWRYVNAINGAHECYVTNMPGFPLDDPQTDTSGMVKIEMPTVMLHELSKIYFQPFMKAMIKIDIEGSESAIFADPESMAELKRFDFIAMEIHRHALHGGLMEEVKQLTDQAFASIAETHHTEYVHPMFYAKKNNHGN